MKQTNRINRRVLLSRVALVGGVLLSASYIQAGESSAENETAVNDAKI